MLFAFDGLIYFRIKRFIRISRSVIMGCSPSHAVIINSSPSQETICLQPRIYMVSESTLCLLRDVGELRVYNVDDRDPSCALEKFQGAQDQLQNPLLFHPQLRRRQRMNAEELQSLAGASNVGAEMENDENTEESLEFVAAIEEKRDDTDHESHFNPIANTDDDLASETARSPNAHSVTVEVYSYKVNDDKTSKADGDPVAKEVTEATNLDVLPKSEDHRENIDAARNFAMASDEKADQNPGKVFEDSAHKGAAMQDQAADCWIESNELFDSNDPMTNFKKMDVAASILNLQQKATEIEEILATDSCNE